jgi:predicted nucleotidyltransferase component of viral defense system
MAADIYARQVRLLVQVLPFVDTEGCFALKGGTAINLFYRDLPRLSVDIDLTYLPVKDRAASLADIDSALDNIASRINSALAETHTQRIAGGGDGETRILVRQLGAEVKIEASPVARGVVNEPTRRRVMPTVEDTYGFAEVKVVAFEDLFGGKIHAALDRQHPRDLYDIKLLYENEGLTEGLFRTFLVYAASSPRPLHELLRPTLKPLHETYKKEFEGMTRRVVVLEDLVAARQRLISDIGTRFGDPVGRFLIGLHDAAPEFGLIGMPQAADLPAVRWKLINLERLKRENPSKHAEQRALLEAVLGQ